MPGVDWLGQGLVRRAGSRRLGRGWEPACAGKGPSRPGAPAAHPSPPPRPRPAPTRAAALAAAVGPGGGPGAGSSRAGTWVTRGDVTAAGRAGVGERAAVCPTSPIVPRGVASRPPPPPRVPFAVTAKVSGWPEPDRTGHRLGRGKRKRGAPWPRPRAAG